MNYLVTVFSGSGDTYKVQYQTADSFESAIAWVAKNVLPMPANMVCSPYQLQLHVGGIQAACFFLLMDERIRGFYTPIVPDLRTILIQDRNIAKSSLRSIGAEGNKVDPEFSKAVESLFRSNNP